ncbi:hypothetical protein SDC9_161352 [bioreactor metagenome]|uniref:Uncharacterized protein n=1 Tax=bioreactor metagenome TaxID=1076179 RepID=A0A645FK38_9ZZZZ
MVFIRFHHIFGTVEVAFQKQQVVGQGSAHALVVSHTVTFDIGFADNVYPVFISQPVKKLGLWIVARSYRIYIVFSEKLKVFPHEFLRNVMSCFFVMLVYVYTFNQNGFAVNKKLFALDLRCSETYFLRRGFNGFSTFVF